MSPIPEDLLANDSVKWSETVGTRFKPTDEVLAGYYLAGKVSGVTDGTIFQLIKDVDIYKLEPSQLSGYAHDFGDRNMYFFTTLQMKYQNGTNVNRLAPGGFWKKTGKPSDVKDNDGKLIGTKTSLAYYKNDKNSGKLVKTQWLMKEYMLLEKQSDEEFRMLAPLTLCVVYFLGNNKRKHSETEIECYDNKNYQSSIPDIAEESSQISATSSSCSFLPPMQNLVMSSPENPDFSRKRHRPDPDLHEIFYSGVSMPSNQNQGNESGSNPVTNIESELAVNIPFANSDQNIQNTEMGSRGNTDSNVQIPNQYLEPDQETFLDFENCQNLDPSMNPGHDELLSLAADLFSNDYKW